MKKSNSSLHTFTTNKTDKSFPLHAPTNNGWFDLSALNEFCETQLDQVINSKFRDIDKEIFYILEFQAVKMWDISALLWLAIALQYYRQEGLRFKIHLPDLEEHMGEFEYKAAAKSGDFLRRWNFDIALSHIDSLERILVSGQGKYFDKSNQSFYKESNTSYIIDGKTEKPLSNRLTAIRDLSTFKDEPGLGTISEKKIEDCILDFHDTNVGNILFSQCGLSKDDAESFADHLVGESLLNMKQHPDATSGFLAISRLGSRDELVLVVVDNGDSIQRTIVDVYNKVKNTHIDINKISEENWDVRSDMLHFATKPFISSKEVSPGTEIGMGLTYIKEDSVDNFHGKFSIISESVQNTYEGNSKNKPHPKEWKHKWKGNLLKLSLPINNSA